MQVDEAEFGKALRFTMLIGAARADSDPETLEKLKREVPTLKAYIQLGWWSKAEKIVRSYMPDGWEPSAEWKVDD